MYVKIYKVLRNPDNLISDLEWNWLCIWEFFGQFIGIYMHTHQKWNIPMLNEPIIGFI